MIAQLALLWIGTVALGLTFGGLTRAVPRYQRNEASLMALVAFAFGVLFWGLFALHSTNYIRLIGGGVTARTSAESLAVVGVIGTILSVLLVLDGAFRLIRQS